MTTELSKEHARSFFSSQGFLVDDIPRAQQETADLRVRFNGEEYIVEAKERSPRPEWNETFRRAESGGYAMSEREIAPWHHLGDQIKKAYSQLVATPSSAGAFRVLWIVAARGDDAFVISCYKKQLLGVCELFAYQRKELEQNFASPPHRRRCYYFDDNDFERYPEIDGAMLWRHETGQLFTNHFSANRERFRKSQLYSLLNESGAVVDAEILARNGEAFMLDTDFCGPRVEGAQQRYLQEKYDALVQVVPMTQLHGVALFPVGQ